MSNLIVNYVSQTPPGIAPAGGIAASIGAPATDSPLGFLAALVDQLLAGGADALKAEAASAPDAKVTTLPGVISFAPAIAPQPGNTAMPAPVDLLAAVTAQIDQLQAELVAGQSPAPETLEALHQALDALSTALEVASPTAPPTTAAPLPSAPLSDQQIAQLLASLGLIEPPSQSTPQAPASAPAAQPQPIPATTIASTRLLGLSQQLAATAPDLSAKLEAVAEKLAATPVALEPTSPAPPADPDALTVAQIIRTLLGNTSTASQPTGAPDPAPRSDAPLVTAPANDDLLKTLTTLGIAPTPQPGSTPAAAPAPATAAQVPVAATVAPPLVRLSNQLTQVATALADLRPELADKIEAVASRTVSGDTELLGKLTSAATGTGDRAVLDRLVQSMIEAKPVIATAPSQAAPAPQLAATAALPTPAPLAPAKKSAVTELKAAQPEPALEMADSPSRSRVDLTAIAREPVARLTREPQPEARAATIIADVAKSDAPPATNSPTPPAPQPATNVPQARPLPAAYQPVANPINMGQVAFEMARQANHGSSRFTIRLDPPDLGRVDVKMHVDATGAVNARLTVDRPETLDLFQRDQRTLERALAQAGLDSGKTNLEFSLRQNSHNPFSGMTGDQQQRHAHSGGGSPRFAFGEGDDLPAMPSITLYRGIASAGGVNIFA